MLLLTFDIIKHIDQCKLSITILYPALETTICISALFPPHPFNVIIFRKILWNALKWIHTLKIVASILPPPTYVLKNPQYNFGFNHSISIEVLLVFCPTNLNNPPVDFSYHKVTTDEAIVLIWKRLLLSKPRWFFPPDKWEKFSYDFSIHRTKTCKMRN